MEADRQRAIELIEEAVTAGARCFRACQIVEIDVRTLQRWKQARKRSVFFKIVVTVFSYLSCLRFCTLRLAWVQGYRLNVLPVSNLARPSQRVPLSGLFVNGLSLHQQRLVIASVTL